MEVKNGSSRRPLSRDRRGHNVTIGMSSSTQSPPIRAEDKSVASFGGGGEECPPIKKMSNQPYLGRHPLRDVDSKMEEMGKSRF